MFKFSTEKLSIVGIWSSAFSLYRQTVGKVWYFVLIMLLIAQSKVAIFGRKITPVVKGAAKGSMPNFDFSLQTALFYLLTFAVSIFVISFVLHRMNHLAEDEKYQVRASTSAVIAKYLTLFSSALLFYIIFGVGLLAFLIPGVILGILFMFNILAILFDDRGWFEALKSSAGLVWGNWWRTFAIFIVPLIIVGLIQMTLTYIFGIDAVSFEPGPALWIYLLISSLVMSLLQPFLYSLMLVQYKDLKLRK
jgi:hypothetical protein